MAHDPDHKSQCAAVCFALCAVALFALFEHALTGLGERATIDAYIACRVVVTSAMFLALIVLARRCSQPGFAALTLNPLALGPALWARATVTLLYQAALAMALSSSGLQAMTYPLFLLHPLWQILAQRIMRGTWPGLSGRITGLAMIMAGVAVFAFGQELAEGLHDAASLLAQLAALAAGAGFAFTNEYGAAITAGPRSAVLRRGQHGDETMSSLELSAYTTYASLWLLPLLLPAIAAVLGAAGLTSMGSDARHLSVDTTLVLLVTAGGAIITLATWLFAEAFRRARKGPQVAALDALILPIGIALDLWSGRLSVHSAVFPAVMVAMVLIVAGVAWATLGEKRRSALRASE